MILKFKSCIFCNEIFNVEEQPSHSCETPCADSPANKIEIVKERIYDTTKTHSIHSPVSFVQSDTENKMESILPNATVLLPQPDLYKMVMELSKKCDSLQKEVDKLKLSATNRFKRNINEYLENDRRAKYTFLEWIHSFKINNDILQLIFEGDLMDGIKKCLNDRIDNEGIFSIPLRFFKEKPEWLFINTDEPVSETTDDEVGKTTTKGGKNEEEKSTVCNRVEIKFGVVSKQQMKEPVWRMVQKHGFLRVVEALSESILKQFYIWEKDNEELMFSSGVNKDLLMNYTLKVMGHTPKIKKDKRIKELYKWFCNKIIQ